LAPFLKLVASSAKKLSSFKISGIIALSIMSIFFTLKTFVTLDILEYSRTIGFIEYLCFISFCIPGYFIVKQFLDTRKEINQYALDEFKTFVNTAVLVSMADAKGKITYVNDKFTKVSGLILKHSSTFLVNLKDLCQFVKTLLI